jgi:hypothetical protein
MLFISGVPLLASLLMPFTLIAAAVYVEKWYVGQYSKEKVLVSLTALVSLAMHAVWSNELNYWQGRSTLVDNIIFLVLIVGTAPLWVRLATKLSNKNIDFKFAYVSITSIAIYSLVEISSWYREVQAWSGSYSTALSSVVSIALLIVFSAVIAGVSHFGVNRLKGIQPLGRLDVFVYVIIVISLSAFVDAMFDEISTEDSFFFYGLEPSAGTIAFSVSSIVGYFLAKSLSKSSDLSVPISLASATLMAYFVSQYAYYFEQSASMLLTRILATAIAMGGIPFYVYIAIRTSRAAEKKGRNKRSWFWLCLLSPVISWFAIASMLPTQNSRQES